MDCICSAGNDGRVRLCGIFFHSNLLNLLSSKSIAREGAGAAGPCPREGVSSQELRVGLGVAAWGRDSWPRAVIRARCWQQQGCHRAHREEAVQVTLGRGTALSDLKMT